LENIMTTEVKAVGPEMTLRELAEFFVDEAVSGAPVEAQQHVVGVVSATDLLEFDAENRAVPSYRAQPEGTFDPLDGDAAWDQTEGDAPARYFAELWEDAGADVKTRFSTESPEWNTLEEHEVSEIMTEKLLALPPSADIREAAKQMLAAGVHRLLVMNGTRLVGLVSSTDIIRAVAEHGLSA